MPDESLGDFDHAPVLLLVGRVHEQVMRAQVKQVLSPLVVSLGECLLALRYEKCVHELRKNSWVVIQVPAEGLNSVFASWGLKLGRDVANQLSLLRLPQPLYFNFELPRRILCQPLRPIDFLLHFLQSLFDLLYTPDKVDF